MSIMVVSWNQRRRDLENMINRIRNTPAFIKQQIFYPTCNEVQRVPHFIVDQNPLSNFQGLAASGLEFKSLGFRVQGYSAFRTLLAM